MRPLGSKDLKTRKPRTSKFVGNTYEGWTIVHIGVAHIQGAGKYRHHRNYYYLAERITSDNKCIKQVRLSAIQMRQLAAGNFDIENWADSHAQNTNAIRKTNYAFINEKENN